MKLTSFLIVVTIFVGIGQRSAARDLAIDARVEDLINWQTVETPESLRANGGVNYASRAFHDRGSAHHTMYRTVTPSGKPALFKVGGADDTDHPADEDFRLQVRGALLAVGIGGPNVFRAGRFHDSDGDAYFVEIEELFPYKSNTFTLKWFRANPQTYSDRRAPKISDLQVSGVGRLLQLALERKIAIVDTDFIFDSGGGVRWIDTAYWSLLDEDFVIGADRQGRKTKDLLIHYREALLAFYNIDRDLGDRVLAAFESSIQSSSKWSTAQKDRIRSSLRAVLSERLVGLPDSNTEVRRRACLLFGATGV